MHSTIDYKGRDDREAARDYVQWFGVRKALMMAKYARYGDRDPNHFAGFVFLSGLGGVSGHPVIAAWTRFTGSRPTDAMYAELDRVQIG